MSSAALQPAHTQATTLDSHSPIVAPSSGRSYISGSGQSREGNNYSQASPTNASPSTNRRPSKRSGGNGNVAPNPTSSSQQYYSPSGSTTNPLLNNRSTASGLASYHNSPVRTTAGTSAYPTMAPGDQQRGPPVISPRTSSNRNAAQAAASAADRASRRGYTDEGSNSNSPRQYTSGDGHNDRVERQRSNGNVVQVNGGSEDPALAAANAAARARRRNTQQEDYALVHRPESSREGRTSSSANPAQRQALAAASNQRPAELSREASEVLNRVIISQPEVDIAREQERSAEAIPSSPHSPQAGNLGVVGDSGVEDAGRGGSRSRHDHTAATGKPAKNTKFGDYFLGSTLGEGEFGKVKMGWKQAGGVQVAIKLIRRDSVGTNPTRLAKIYREIAILREISHPNIVRLHEMVETEKQIGIILEYASGGELFDYILNHRYLKDNAARRLFAQLVSGVGYLHKKGIVHRDLKLENLLLDRNRNIIITDFGFANTFNPDDELGEAVEHQLNSRDFVKRMELDKILPGGHRRGDLMQTSCGSPCYAAPELVVSDQLYTGRKVDVWSCGVILYAMLAGYLPFDDDPANPEGDNINLLYKYIVSTPLTFPEYVTPHARDLLRRILVADPRKRADLFEVARHSWLSDYAHVVQHVTSPTTTIQDISSTAVPTEERDAPQLGRSASVREPTSKTQKPAAAVGDLSRKHGDVNNEAPEPPQKTTKDNKRRTVQVEYVPPRSQTQRGEQSAAAQGSSRSRARAGSQGPVEVASAQAPRRTDSSDKPLPHDPPRDDRYASQGRRPSSSSRQNMPPPARPGRETARAASDTNYLSGHAPPPVSIARPTTGGSMTSSNSRNGSMNLVTRGSYSQPAVATVAGTNAQGRISQPKQTGHGYNISAPMMDSQQTEYGRPSVTSQSQGKAERILGDQDQLRPQHESKGHRRSSTFGGMFGRANSIFGGKRDQSGEKPSKKYPPVSMTSALGRDDGTPRQSIDSRRSISFGFGKKRSGSIAGSQTTTLQEKPRRFSSLIPSNFNLKAIGIGKEPTGNDHDGQVDGTNWDDEPPQTARTTGTRNMSGATAINQPYSVDSRGSRAQSSSQHYRNATQPSESRSTEQPQFLPPLNFNPDQSTVANTSDTSLMDTINAGSDRAAYPPGFNEYDNDSRRQTPSQAGNRLQKPNRKFTDGYEESQGNGYGPTHTDHAGSSGAARKVMDFFRRRGRDRGF